MMSGTISYSPSEDEQHSRCQRAAHQRIETTTPGATWWPTYRYRYNNTSSQPHQSGSSQSPLTASGLHHQGASPTLEATAPPASGCSIGWTNLSSSNRYRPIAG